MITLEDVRTAPTVAAIVLMSNPRRDVTIITCASYPRLAKFIDRSDAYYTIDGYRVEKPGLAAAVELLNTPPRPSPLERVELELEKLRKGPAPAPAELV